MTNQYIEREAAKRELLSWAVCINHPEYLIKDDALHIIDSIPAADVAEKEVLTMTEYIENPLSGKLRGVTYEDGKIIDVHIRDTDGVVKVFVPMASEKEATGMMDVREKLVELIFDSLCRHIDKSCKLAENIADHLIANGVTVQEWISVDDRLPEKDGQYLIFTTQYFTPDHIDEIDHIDGIEISGYSKRFGFLSKNGLYAKYWREMPQPPKGE